jgi:hypothetical protein
MKRRAIRPVGVPNSSYDGRVTILLELGLYNPRNAMASQFFLLLLLFGVSILPALDLGVYFYNLFCHDPEIPCVYRDFALSNSLHTPDGVLFFHLD